MKAKMTDLIKGLRGTYGLVFFSNNSMFAILLLLASFIDPGVGAAGLVSGLFCLLLAKWLGLDPQHIYNGTYSFNSLLTGLALGAYFKFTAGFLPVLLAASALTLLITVLLASLSGRSRLPFLSLPFIFTLWILLLNARSFESGFLLPKDAAGCQIFWCEGLRNTSLAIQQALPGLCVAYFKSLAAVFFQNNLLSGVLIALGLLLYSRIAFVLSLTGFFAGWLYARLMHGNLNDQEYALLAFNYMLTALALGGYFVIASGASFLLVLLCVPVLGLLIPALYAIPALYTLPLYSLPFSVMVILVVALLNNRYFFKHLNLVYIQQFSPEKNLYAFHTFMQRFKKDTGIAIHLPFFGEWTVSQGHNGALTHKADYRFALDFVVTDEHKRSFKFPGKKVTDFYCYGLPVLAPADGQVITIEDGIDDNEIGDANLQQNWGNTIVIKHGEALFSKLSHLKKGSFKIKQGDKVKKGDLLALCGNSGRSPEPHVHFQLQALEYVGAPTIDLPISTFLVKTKDGYELKFFETPKEGDVLQKPAVSPALKKAFHFIPGMKLNWQVNDGDTNYTESWEVITDALNVSYLYCEHSHARAYFASNDTLFYFTGFEGSSNCLLFYFYLGAYKIVLSEFENLWVNDILPVQGVQRGVLKFLQDLVAPFSIFIRPEYTSAVKELRDGGADKLKIQSEVRSNMRFGRNLQFGIRLAENKISQMEILENGKCITAKLVS